MPVAPYVSVRDVHVALSLYYDGVLDEVDISRVNAPLEYLTQYGPLVSSLESGEIDALLEAAPAWVLNAIDSYHERLPLLWPEAAHTSTRSPRQDAFVESVDVDYASALVAFSEAIANTL